MKQPETFDHALLALRHQLELMARWGCRGFDCPQETLAIMQRWAGPIRKKMRETKPETAAAETLPLIRGDLGECVRCRLGSQRTNLVFGEGADTAELVFVGEAPGQEEDLSGRPFVGPAGQLLTRIIEAMKLDRQRVYICNVVKCRPPGNRHPEPDEIAACRPFMLRQLAAIKPKAVCALGACAAQTLLETTAPISKLRGRFHDVNGITVMPTFHPSYLLRHPEQKRAVWEDAKKIMALLRIPLL